MAVREILLCMALTLSAMHILSAGETEPSGFVYPDAHDPAVAFCDGRCYVITTGMGIMSSADMVHWQFEGNVLESTPEWAREKGFDGMPWAPDIQYFNGQYYVYYSYSVFGRNISAIGVATNRTLNPDSDEYRWIDHGMVIESVPGRDEWNAIDANVTVDEDGIGWMSFGSFWRGIKMFRLDGSLTRVAEPQEWYPLCRRPEGTARVISGTADGIEPDPRGKDFDPGDGAVEAPFIFRHGGWYYLFVSYDLCCRGAESTYNVVVGRSRKLTGPYLDRDGRSLMDGAGTVVACGNDRYSGVGHCAVVSSGGRDYMFMHGYDRDYDYRSKLLIREISWTSDGWPEVEL